MNRELNGTPASSSVIHSNNTINETDAVTDARDTDNSQVSRFIQVMSQFLQRGCTPVI